MSCDARQRIVQAEATGTDPAGAEIVQDEHGGGARRRKFARWQDGRGNLRTAPLNARGDRIVTDAAATDPWLISYQDKNTWKRVTVGGGTDRAAAEAKRRRLVKASEQAAEGVTDPFLEHARTPLSTVVGEWFAGLRCKRAPQMKMQVNRVLDGTGATRLHRLDAPHVERYLAQLKRSDGFGDVTEDEYRASLRALTRWAVSNKRIAHDPLAGLKRIKRSTATLHHERRGLTLEQVGRLLHAAETRPVQELETVRTGRRKGQRVANVREAVRAKAARVGRMRRLAYLLAFWARLRRSEIRSLTWGDIRLDSYPSKVQLRGHRTKAKRADSMPIHPQLAEALRQFWHEAIDPTTRVVDGVPGMKALRADLKAAGIEYELDGRYADLHSLGKSFLTACATHGVSQRAAQAMARHTDPRLTAGTYTDERLLPLAAELAKVPAIPDPASEAPHSLRLRATGTDGGAPAYDPDRAADDRRAGAGRVTSWHSGQQG